MPIIQNIAYFNVAEVQIRLFVQPSPDTGLIEISHETLVSQFDQLFRILILNIVYPRYGVVALNRHPVSNVLKLRPEGISLALEAYLLQIAF